MKQFNGNREIISVIVLSKIFAAVFSAAKRELEKSVFIIVDFLFSPACPYSGDFSLAWDN